MRKTVFILGAGFSNYAGIPLLDRFLPEARRMLYRAQVKKPHAAFYEAVFEHVGRLENSGKYIDFNFHNLEEVFGLIEIAHALDDKGEHDTLACFRRLVKHLIGTKQDEFFEIKPHRWGLYTRFLEMFIAPNYGEASLVTFNYDELLETACQRYFDVVNKSVGVVFRTRFENKQDGNVDLLKLHGSINWTRRDGEPHIIPPTWNKALGAEDQAVFGPIWKRASEHVGNAERLVFIGYSFPPTDQYFRQLLTFSLASNKRLQDLIVVNPSADVAGRFEAVLDVHFRRYYRSFPLNMEYLVEPGWAGDRKQLAKDCVTLILS